MSIILALSSHAFDPVTATTTANIAKSFLDDAAEAAESVGVILEIAREFDINTDTADEEVARINSVISQMQSELSRYKYAYGDIRANVETLSSKSSSLRSKLQAFKRTIEAAKRIMLLMAARNKTAHKIASVQQVALQSSILDELHGIRTALYVSFLEKEQKRLERELYVRRILAQERDRIKSRRLK